MRRKTWLLLLMLALSLTTALTARADCTTYSSSHAEDYDLPDGPACTGGGSGCTECVDLDPATGSGRVCIWSSIFDYYCLYFGQPDIQR